MKLKGMKVLYNAEAHFTLREKFGEENLAQVLIDGGRKGFDMLCEVLSEVQNQAELYRRREGYDKGRLLSPADIQQELLPSQYAEAVNLVLTAMAKGMTLPEDPEEEVDEVLEALKEKNA